MVICLAYPSDLKQVFAFYCARYENIKYEKFLKLGYEEFMMKLSSIPETEPLYNIIKSRIINVEKIKDKNEKKYWKELKQINKIPDVYKSPQDIQNEMKRLVKNNNFGGKRW